MNGWSVARSKNSMINLVLRKDSHGLMNLTRRSMPRLSSRATLRSLQRRFLNMKYYEAIRDAQFQMMRHNPNVFICGLGVPDPKGVFGSTMGLLEEFGPNRVFDTPACENATVGMMLGA